MAITKERDNMLCMGGTTLITITTGTSMAVEMIEFDLMFPLNKENLPLGLPEVT